MANAEIVRFGESSHRCDSRLLDSVPSSRSALYATDCTIAPHSFATFSDLRGAVDSHQRQILRGNCGCKPQIRSARIETRIRNAQAHLRTLTGDVRLKVASQWELIPQEPPLDTLIPVSQRDATIQPSIDPILRDPFARFRRSLARWCG